MLFFKFFLLISKEDKLSNFLLTQLIKVIVTKENFTLLSMGLTPVRKNDGEVDR